MNYRIFRGLFRIIFRIFYRMEVLGRENVPETGGVILCANHRSNWDPPIVGSQIERFCRFMAKEELFKFRPFGKFLYTLGAFPVKRGAVSKQSIVDTLRLIKQGEIITIFPEGPRNGGTAKRGVATFALRSRAIVIPVAIIGTYKLFSTMRIVYGKPLDLSQFEGDTSEDGQRAADYILAQIHRLMDDFSLNNSKDVA